MPQTEKWGLTALSPPGAKPWRSHAPGRGMRLARRFPWEDPVRKANLGLLLILGFFGCADAEPDDEHGSSDIAQFACAAADTTKSYTLTVDQLKKFLEIHTTTAMKLGNPDPSMPFNKTFKQAGTTLKVDWDPKTGTLTVTFSGTFAGKAEKTLTEWITDPKVGGSVKSSCTSIDSSTPGDAYVSYDTLGFTDDQFYNCLDEPTPCAVADVDAGVF